MSGRCVMDKAMKKLLLSAQEGIPIGPRPYKGLGQKTGLSEEEVISRLESLRNKKLLKRIDFAMDTHRLGLVSTLVGCKIPEKEIARAGRIIGAHVHITHNYLRRNRLNMWFTLSASSQIKLKGILRALRQDLRAEEFVSLPTEKVFKLRLRLHAE